MWRHFQLLKRVPSTFSSNWHSGYLLVNAVTIRLLASNKLSGMWADQAKRGMSGWERFGEIWRCDFSQIDDIHLTAARIKSSSPANSRCCIILTQAISSKWKNFKRGWAQSKIFYTLCISWWDNASSSKFFLSNSKCGLLASDRAQLHASVADLLQKTLSGKLTPFCTVQGSTGQWEFFALDNRSMRNKLFLNEHLWVFYLNFFNFFFCVKKVL